MEKLLVSPDRRRLGVAAAMMRMLEEVVVRESGRTMLVGAMVCCLFLFMISISWCFWAI
jgi:hypothetical protein